ncbi:Ig-like domain-containing protein [Candidatus Uhrbacteria bacterium]|nr:Ig-like domain-containing protein [Candidatus Uhrbacteria bacterium]
MRVFSFLHLRTRTLRSLFGSVAFGIFGFFFSASPALAQSSALEQVGTQATLLGQRPLIEIIELLILAFLSIIGIIAVVMILYAGYVIMTSAGDARRVEQGRNVLKNAVIGLIIILASWAIVVFIFRLLGVNVLTGVGTRTDLAGRYTDPLSGPLGLGIVQDHYPPRGALDVARNTNVFLTFKEAVDPNTVMVGFVDNGDGSGSGQIADTSVEFFKSADITSKFLPADVKVFVTKDHKVYTFDPVNWLGDGVQDTNYTVHLTSDIKKDDTADAFAGYPAGYSWTFEVGTTVDLTPPYVVSRVPAPSSPAVDKNTIASITFNEAMNPVATTGHTLPFTNLVLDNGGTPVVGVWQISNGYRTVEFIPAQGCATDPCGNTVYCLPGAATISGLATAATIDTSIDPTNTVQSVVPYDGVVDAAGNSLDGGVIGGDGTAGDDFPWSFTTTNFIDTATPAVVGLSPAINKSFASLNDPITITFNRNLQPSTVSNSNLIFHPSTSLPDYSVWFTGALGITPNIALIEHPPLISDMDGGLAYFQEITHGLKGSNQFCMYPALSGGTLPVCASDSTNPNCCSEGTEPSPLLTARSGACNAAAPLGGGLPY